MYYVYILKCKGKKSYVGCTKDLKKRLKQHQSGHSSFTKNTPPENLIVYHAFKDKYLAFKFEKYLKSGSGRAFMKRHFFEQEK